MKIIVIGGGDREHTLIWKLSQSPNVDKIYCASGNAGIARLAECVDINDTDVDTFA
jgi:phosphoribosylamine---glycine ligase